MINIDSFFTIGKTHQICQDYAISFNDPFPCVILADGCSSSKYSEIGSHLLVHAAKDFLNHFDPYEFTPEYLGTCVIHNCNTIRKSIGLNVSCLDSTLIIAFVYDNRFYVYLYGDGYVISVLKDNSICYHKINFSASMPYYLSYEVDIERQKNFNYVRQEKTYETWVKEGSIIKKLDVTIGIQDDKYLYTGWPIDNCKHILIASDGIGSFIDKENNPVDLFSVIEDCTDFKTTPGEFIKRRMNSKKGVLNTYKEKGIVHFDDLSIGGFSFV